MKNRESWISPLPLWGRAMKDPENEAVFRIVIVGSVSFKSGMEYYNTVKMMLHLGEGFLGLPSSPMGKGNDRLYKRGRI